jgi:4-aminobutyrate aminotransferase-like enzyme
MRRVGKRIKGVGRILTAKSRALGRCGKQRGAIMAMPAGPEGDLLERRRRVMGPHALLFYNPPLHLVRGDGVWLFDSAGLRYLDAYNNVPHVGHSNERVAEAVSRQVRTLNTHTRYLHEGVIRYAEQLVATVEAALDRVYFCCTGTEANELALRMARHRTNAQGVIVSSHSYHGNSRQLASLATGLRNPEPFPDWARAVTLPDPFRSPDQTVESLTQRFLETVAVAVESLVASGAGVAAILLDPLLTFEGLPAIPPSAISAAIEIVRAAGGLYIADEVQGGLGRTGRFFWAHERYTASPDLVTVGKPIANGIPMAAVLATAEIADSFGASATYFNTFAGSPVACAAAQATLEVLDADSLCEQAVGVGAYLRHRLLELTGEFELLGDVRGEGLYQGVEVTAGPHSREPGTATAQRIVSELARRGVLISSTGPANSVLKIRPPMPFALEHADLLIESLRRVMDRLADVRS